MFMHDRMGLFVLRETPELHSFTAKVAGNAVTAEAEASAGLNFEKEMNDACELGASPFEIRVAVHLATGRARREREVGAYF